MLPLRFRVRFPISLRNPILFTSDNLNPQDRFCYYYLHSCNKNYISGNLSLKRHWCFLYSIISQLWPQNYRYPCYEKYNSQYSELLLSSQTIRTMKVSFEDAELERLVITHQSKKYKKYIRDKKFLWALDRVFNDLQGAAKCSDLKQLSYLHYERLRKKGMSSVRVMNGRVERLLFQELDNGIRITIIELDESHYGQR